MRLSEQYQNEIIQSFKYFRDSGNPLEVCDALGQSHNLFLSKINFRDFKLELCNVVKQARFTIPIKNIVTVYSGDRSNPISSLDTRFTSKEREQPNLPNTGVDFFEVCRAASIARKTIRVSLVTGEQYIGSVLGINRYSVGLTELQNLRGKIDIFFDWVTAIEVL